LAQIGVFEAPRVQLATGLSSTMERRPLADGRTTISHPAATPVSFTGVGQRPVGTSQ